MDWANFLMHVCFELWISDQNPCTSLNVARSLIMAMHSAFLLSFVHIAKIQKLPPFSAWKSHLCETRQPSASNFTFIIIIILPPVGMHWYGWTGPECIKECTRGKHGNAHEAAHNLVIISLPLTRLSWIDYLMHTGPEFFSENETVCCMSGSERLFESCNCV